MAGAYVGREAPLVSVARDFDLQKLDGQQVGQYLSMWTQGAISHELLLDMLQRGEILPDIDIDAEIELIESNKLNDMDLAAAGGNLSEEELQPPQESSGDEEEEVNAVRQLSIGRLRRLAEEDDSDEGSN
jgi:hypothetical protein